MKTIENKKIRIALLGLGTVGSGVYEVLGGLEGELPDKIGAKLEIGKILVRDLTKAGRNVKDPSVLTNDWNSILKDPTIDIVVEVMGGMEPAKTYILQALQ